MKTHKVTLDFTFESEVKRDQIYDLLDNIAQALKSQVEHSEVGLAPGDGNLTDNVVLTSDDYDAAICYDCASGEISTL